MPTGGGFTGCCGPDGKTRSDQELEVLCDASGAPFLRRYTVASDGAVTSVDTMLDGTTAYTPAEPVGVCATGNGGNGGEDSPGEPSL